jgi:hypothetical protein
MRSAHHFRVPLTLLCAALLTGSVVTGASSDSTATKSAPASTPAAPAAPAPQMTMKQAKEKLGIVVFPAKGQTAETQEAEELACLQWGAEQAGVLPNNAKDPKAEGQAAAAHVDSAAQGAAVKGAAKGAAVGAIIGSISGNAGEGAAYGAAGGAVAGRRAKKKATAQAQSQAEQKAAAENQAKLEAVKKGMSACLESKGYTVK